MQYVWSQAVFVFEEIGSVTETEWYWAYKENVTWLRSHSQTLWLQRFASGMRWCCPALLFRTLQICLMRLQQMLQTNLLAVLQTAACISWSLFTQCLLLLSIHLGLYCTSDSGKWSLTGPCREFPSSHEHLWVLWKLQLVLGPALSTSLFKSCVC